MPKNFLFLNYAHLQKIGIFIGASIFSALPLAAEASNGVESVVGILIFSISALIVLLALVLSVGLTILWIWMLIDATRREFPKSDEKVVWILVLVLAGIMGAVIYYFLVKRKLDAKKR